MSDVTTLENEHPQYRMNRPSKELHHYLLGWYDAAKRSMPWRETTDPYAIWLSETMLQQTQVETVKPYYHRFLAAFPTLADLSSADLQQVLAMWAGLGYYRRARNLHAAAQRMVEQFDGKVPHTMEGLLSLPGVGRYTAGAVGSIAFGLPVAVVDGNVMRVLSRLTGFDGEISAPVSVAFFWQTAEAVVHAASAETPPRYGDVNQAMMELGATICTPPPSRPACLLCPVRSFCRAYAEGRQLELPVKKKKADVPLVLGTALVITRNAPTASEVLLMQRPRGVTWEEMWEFPVVDCAGLPKVNGCMGEWIAKTVGLPITEVERAGKVTHTLTHRRMDFTVIRATTGSLADPVLPPGATMGDALYTAFRWLPWPLALRGPVPLARVVHKIAAAVQ